MRVFISHKREDMDTAEIVASRLRELGFEIYFDKYDPYISESNDRAVQIKSEIEKSTDLLVIITEKTERSWWVPFEIGLSTFADIRIVSILMDDTVVLPSFIKKWPIIDTAEKYEMYFDELQKSKIELIKESKIFEKSFINSNLSEMRKSDIFHKILLSKFNQY